MNLMCTESQRTSEDKCFAEDRAIFRDERAVKKLLETESQYVPECDYMAHPQSSLQPFMRRVVATWMLDVSRTYWCSVFAALVFRAHVTFDRTVLGNQ